MDFNELIAKASKTFRDNFPGNTCFERAIFYSWYCKIRDCAYCYMSTQKDTGKIAKRSDASILAEALLCKHLGWDIGFFSGGIGAYTVEGFENILKKLTLVLQQKIWLNIGALSMEELQRYRPYIKGVVGSIETINPEVHEKVCPSKPIQPYLEMYLDALNLNLRTAMTIILGLGETIADYPRLKEFIEKYKIDKIHFYGLNPQKGTVFENAKPPTAEYQAEWIAKTRVDFPAMDIQCGIWLDRVDRVALLLKAGAISVSKFPAIRKFNSKEAKEIESQAKRAGRRFIGTLTKLPEVDWDEEVEALAFDEKLKKEIKEKLEKYLKKMG